MPFGPRRSAALPLIPAGLARHSFLRCVSIAPGIDPPCTRLGQSWSRAPATRDSPRMRGVDFLHRRDGYDRGLAVKRSNWFFDTDARATTCASRTHCPVAGLLRR